jgi:threonine/homoserine/homoserine lactone efflux protein
LKIIEVEYVVQGLIYGMSLSILLGPIFVALTQTSLSAGWKAGMWVGVGIWSSDLAVILGSYYFTAQFKEMTTNPLYPFWSAIIGGSILALVGIMTFLSSPKPVTENTETKKWIKTGYFGKGFAVNFFNPFTFFFWFTLMHTYGSLQKTTTYEIVMLFSTILTTIVLTDSAKVLAAAWISKRMSPSIIQITRQIAGLIIFGAGIVILIKSI